MNKDWRLRLVNNEDLEHKHLLTEDRHIFNAGNIKILEILQPPLTASDKLTVDVGVHKTTENINPSDVEFVDRLGNPLNVVIYSKNQDIYWEYYNDYVARRSVFNNKVHIIEYLTGYIAGLCSPMGNNIRGMQSANNYPGYQLWQQYRTLKLN